MPQENITPYQTIDSRQLQQLSRSSYRLSQLSFGGSLPRMSGPTPSKTASAGTADPQDIVIHTSPKPSQSFTYLHFYQKSSFSSLHFPSFCTTSTVDTSRYVCVMLGSPCSISTRFALPDSKLGVGDDNSAPMANERLCFRPYHRSGRENHD